MEWFLDIVEFMMLGGSRKCSGAMVIDKLCDAIQTGYTDIEEAALSLVRVAETAWLKQVSAWILYGRLPSFGREDFFVQTAGHDIQVRFLGILLGLMLIRYRSIKANPTYYLHSCLRQPPPHCFF
jgi:hypothetical protein